ncbi:MAG: heat-inducible transcription repressor HrcA [Anaerolineales bacterium]|nr:heat-inducible transcription repressor HrcA [Anaerolineales bacterium]MCB9126572.1 heat-inducible transcription repressor HrcA [Ardenticatenales bacterium]MCB9172502.1 heat-inducible transcription repressor HrcA [Ardenticatenales bacterium]
MDHDLTERQERVLAFVVREYIRTALPVSSNTVMQGGQLDVSSATIRNEMSYLEEVGLMTHPHTSAGRLPTEAGYRYFVERLMEQAALPDAEQRLIRHQFHQARMDVEQWMRLSAAVLAHTTNAASIVTLPQATRCRVKHIELIGLSEGMVLVVLVLQEGLVKQQLIRTSNSTHSQEQLNQKAQKLNALFREMDGTMISNRPADLTMFEARVRETIVAMMERVDRRGSSDLYRDGLLHILRQPEFASAEAIRQIVEILEERALIEQIAAELRSTSGVQVIIGGEGRWQEISDVSLVIAPYGVEGHAAGIMGVVGPMRMPYGRAISAVRFMTGLMSHLLSDLYLPDPRPRE